MAYEPGPQGWSVQIPDGPGVDPKTVDLRTLDPFYAGDIERIDTDAAEAARRAQRDYDRGQKLYAINVAHLNASAGGGGEYGFAAAERAAALQREKAAHDDVNWRENMRERLASRGALQSGQFGWENKEQDWQLAMMNKQIESDLQSRRDAAASAKADAQARLQSQLAEMQLRNSWAGEDLQDDLYDIKTGAGRSRGSAAVDAWQRLVASGAMLPKTIPAVWNPEKGVYETKDGRYFDGNLNPTSWSPPGTGGGGGGGPAPSSADIPNYYDPGTNVTPGDWRYE